MIGERLRQLRLARGLTQDALIEMIGEIITKQALSKYENEKMKPSATILREIASALGVKTAQIFSEPEYRFKFVAFRKGSTVRKREQERIQYYVRESLLNRIKLQELAPVTQDYYIPVHKLKVSTLDEIEDATNKLRNDWHIGLDPIRNVREVLEDHNIFTIDFETQKKADGGSVIAYDEDNNVKAVAVGSRRNISGERQRFNFSHELGHLVLNIPDSVDEEKAANRFAGAFLTPKKTLIDKIGNKRIEINIEELKLLKEKFGTSIQSLLYRLKDLGIISQSYYTQWCKYINMHGWKRHEPNELPAEESHWVKQQALRAISEGLLTVAEAESLVGENLDIEETSSPVREFMKLSLEQRRKILEKQAEKSKEHYENDDDWREFQGGDFVDY